MESFLRCVKAASSAFAMEWRDQAERKTCYAWCNEKRRLGNVELKVRLENHDTEAKLVGLTVEQLTLPIMSATKCIRSIGSCDTLAPTRSADSTMKTKIHPRM